MGAVTDGGGASASSEPPIAERDEEPNAYPGDDGTDTAGRAPWL